MAYIDALQDTITINTVATQFKVGDLVGQTEKVKTPLYSNIKARFYSNSNSSLFSRLEEGKQEKYRYSFGVQVEPQYNGASEGDEVVFDSKNYIITKKQEIKGTTSATHHVIYLLQEGE